MAELEKGECRMTVVFVFKNGYELKVKCKDITLTTNNLLGQVTGCEMEGVEDNKLLYTDFSEIICVYRIITDEDSEQNE